MENPVRVEPGDIVCIDPGGCKPYVIENNRVNDYFDKLWLAEIGIKA